MSINPDNWDGYLAGFRQCFPQLNSTDPNRFPKGKYDQVKCVDTELMTQTTSAFDCNIKFCCLI